MFVSGQLPVNPATGAMPESVKEQAIQSLTNIKMIVNEAGVDMKDIRSTVQVARLPKDAEVEIEAIAICSK